MDTTGFFYAGFIVKALGVDGSVLIVFEKDQPVDYTTLESVFVCIDGKLVPFFIEDITFRATEGEAVIRFEDYSDVERARHLCGREVYLPQELLAFTEKTSSYHYDLQGYKSFDTTGNFLGTVKDILRYPGNPVFRIIQGRREILIPVADELIADIDHRKHTIILDPPDGLLDL